MRNVTILSGSKSRRLAKNIAERITLLAYGEPKKWAMDTRDINFAYSDITFEEFSDGMFIYYTTLFRLKGSNKIIFYSSGK